MGTRSLTVVFDDWRPEQECGVMYRQYDGYVSGHGHELAEFLADGKVVNGLGADPGKVFNGMGCLAAQMVAHFKEGPGGIYLYPSGTRDAGEEYVYEIRHLEGDLEVTVIRYGEVIFKGSPGHLLAFDETPGDEL